MWGNAVTPFDMRTAAASLIFFAGTLQTLAQQTQCEASAFRETVALASASISELHERNNRTFQEELQKLRAANHWSEVEFIAKASPLVKDETTAAFDAANQALLAHVQSIEAGNVGSEAGRCAVLGELKAALDKVIANTSAKWDHMLAKLAKASAEPLRAGVTQ
jgi:hypothetical protein